MNDSLIIAVVSVVLVIGLIIVFAYSYFYYARRDVLLMWRVIRIKLGERLDKIPMMVERSKMNGINIEGLEELISARSNLWQESDFGVERVRSELMISSKLKELFALLGKNEELKKDVYFLSQKEEIKEIGGEIEGMTESFNRKVRAYNSKVGFFIIKPVTAVMKFKEMPIFEFEP